MSRLMKPNAKWPSKRSFTCVDLRIHTSSFQFMRRRMFESKKKHLVCYKTRRNGQLTALFLTYIAYMGLHVTRKSFSNIKTNLAYPICRADLGHKIFGPDRSLCCKGTLKSNTTKNEETCSGDVSSVCS